MNGWSKGELEEKEYLGSLSDSLISYQVQDQFSRQPVDPNSRDLSKKKI